MASAGSSSILKGAWRPTKIMNMRDLSRDDDFLSHLLVEKLGTGDVPLVVHKMDPARRLPKTDTDQLLQIVRRLVASKGPMQTAIRQAVDDLLSLTAVRYYLRSYTQKQVNAFATHASRYFELYLPSGSIEIAHTSRYSHQTGKSELCILATRPLTPGQVVSELKGSMADLTEEEDKELKGGDQGNADGESGGIRRDFSVIHSKQLKKNHLFLGPARFVNHDCDHNVELFREGRYITFRVIRHIAVGEEVTAHYGDGYFGRNNRHCLCESCEKRGRGGYAPHNDEDGSESGSAAGGAESDDGQPDDSASNHAGPSSAVNVNERRTRRGVYAVVAAEQEQDGSDEESAAHLPSIPTDDLFGAGPSKTRALPTPDPDTDTVSAVSTPRKATDQTAVVSRARKTRATSEIGNAKGKGVAGSRSASTVRQLETPPLTSDSASQAGSVRSSSRVRTRASAALAVAGDKEEGPSRVGTPVAAAGRGKGKGKEVDVKGKNKEDPELESRTLRKRVFAQADQQALNAKKPSEAPRGVDGKPLPTCVTCRNVLPVISVDHQVVWGLSLGRTGKRGRPKKNVNLECPRCIRHFAIYALKWPERIPSHGASAFVPAPRENRGTPLLAPAPARLSHNAVASVSRKLAANAESASAKASNVAKRKAEVTQEDEDSRPAKKQKLSTGRPRGRPPKNKVGMSTNAKKLLGVASNEGRRSERVRVPTLKLRESEPPPAAPPKPKPLSITLNMGSIARPPVSSASASSEVSAATSELTPPESDGIDRPPTPTRSHGRLVPKTPTKGSSASPPKQLTPKSLAVAGQPRESNGRFGKKATTNGRFMRKNFTFTPGGRRLARSRHKYYAGGNRESGSSEDGQIEVKQEATEGSSRLPALLMPKRSRGEPEAHSVSDGDTAPAKRARVDRDKGKDMADEEDGDSDEEEPGGPVSYRRPMLGMGRSSSSLYSRPNPHSFARRKWVSSSQATPEAEAQTPPLEPSSIYGASTLPTDDDSSLPVTPGDQPMMKLAKPDRRDTGAKALNGTGHDGVGVDSLIRSVEKAPTSGDAQPDEPRRGAQGLTRPKMPMRAGLSGPFTHKPSPFNLAARRWGLPNRFEVEPESRRVNPGVLPFDNDDRSEEEEDRDGDEGDDRSVGSYSEDDTSSEKSGFRGPRVLPMCRPRVVARPARRRSSSSSIAIDLTDDSEQMVERLVAQPHSGPGSTSSIPGSPQKSPNMGWKETVLLPMNVPFTSRTAGNLVADVAAMQTKLISAGWDNSASDDTD